MTDSAIIPSSPMPSDLATVGEASGELGRKWAQCRDDWLATRKSDRTRRAYDIALTRFLATVKRSAWDVTPVHVAAYGKALESLGKGDATRALALAAISSFYRYAQAVGLIDRNPAAGVPRPSIEPYGRAVALEQAQAAAVLRQPDRSTTEGRRDYAMLLLEFSTGIRRAELVGIRRGDLAETPAGDIILTYHPKGGKEATRPVPRRAVAALQAYLADRGPLAAGDPVFVAHDRGASKRPPRPLTAEAWRNIVTKYTEAALGFRVHPHALRHTAATLAWHHTHDLKQVQSLLGHRHVVTTQRYIDHLEDNRAQLGDDLAAMLGA